MPFGSYSTPFSGLQSWNPGGISLSYVPQVQTIGSPLNFGGGTVTDTGGGGGGGKDKKNKHVFGQYDPNNPLKIAPGTITPEDDWVQGLDKLMQSIGLLGTIDKGSAFPTVDPKQAAALGSLGKGSTGSKETDAIVTSLLSLGAPAPKDKKGKKGK